MVRVDTVNTIRWGNQEERGNRTVQDVGGGGSLHCISGSPVAV